MVVHIPLDYLKFSDNKAIIYSQNFSQLIKKIQVPCYIFLPKRFESNYNLFLRAMKRFIPNFFIAYALKANYLGSLLRLARDLGCGIEVMSMFELLMAKRIGFSNNKIIMNGPAKTIDELKFVIENAIPHINVDSMNELKVIERLAAKSSVVQPVSIRIHPLLSAETEKKMLIKKNSKLGIDYARAKKLFKYAKNSSHLEVQGLHVHVGTSLTSNDFFDELLTFVGNYINELEKDIKITLNTINLGGGLASRIQLQEADFKLELLAKQVSEKIDDLKDRIIIFEPGRYLVGDSFIAIANVLRIKKSWGRQWAFLDIGANTLIPLRYSKFYLVPAIYKGEGQPTHIGGPLCLPVDVLLEKPVNFVLEENDKVIILNCGAYTLSMSEQFGYPRPPIYELNDSKIKLVHKGDNIEEMVKFWLGQ